MRAVPSKYIAETSGREARFLFGVIVLVFMRACGLSTGADVTDQVCHNITHPAISPSGDQLLYVSDEAGNLDIFVADISTGRRQRLTTSPANETRPSWSGDASRIVFDSDRAGNRDVFVMEADGSEVTQLTHSSADDAFGRLSPDGTALVFHSDRNSTRDIFLMEMGSRVAKSLVSSAGRDGVPSWSPDGMTVLFHSTRTRTLHFQLYSLDFSKRTIERLSFTQEPEEHAAFSPDGMHIAFYREHPQRRRNAELIIMDLATERRQILVTHDRFAVVGEYAPPSWFPDGKSIAFWAKEAGQACSSIYFINLQTKQLVKFR